MSYLKKIGYAGALSASLAMFALPGTMTANAMPNAAAQTKIATDGNSNLIKAEWHGRRHNRGWRRHHWRRHHNHYGDWNPGAYIALGVIGALVNQGMSEGAAQSAMQRCDDRFRSFEPSTGLYTTYGGEKRLCPYLR